MSKTGLVFDEACLKHFGWRDHSECPERALSIHRNLVDKGLVGRCVPIPSREATPEELRAVHDEAYVSRVLSVWDSCAEDGNPWFCKICQCKSPQTVRSCPLCDTPKPSFEEEYRVLTGTTDTYVSRGTSRAAKIAAGSVAALCEAVVRGQVQNGLAVVRPPGHHAGRASWGGFCFFNNVAVAAAHVRQNLGVQKILILDWDVHHGNGTQEIFDSDPNTLFFSIHRYDGGLYYPKTGHIDRVGTDGAQGSCVNIPLCKGLGDADFVACFASIFMPIAREFNPELVIVSAGFDAALGDPKGEMKVSPEGFAYLTRMVMSLANGRVVLALEGGYNVRVIAEDSEACLRALLGESPSGAPLLAPEGDDAGFIMAAPRKRGEYASLSRVFEKVQEKTGGGLTAEDLRRSLPTEIDLSAVEVSPVTVETITRVMDVQAPHWVCMRQL